MKIILFEGPDKVGKSTTINVVKDYLISKGRIPLELSLPFLMDRIYSAPSELLYRLKLQMRNLIDMSHEFSDNYVCLLDRFHLSERVYGEVLRHNCNYTEISLCDMRMKMLGAALIYIAPDNEEENFEKFSCSVNKTLDGLTKEQYLETVHAFDECVYHSEIAHKYKLTTSKITASLEAICDHIINQN